MDTYQTIVGKRDTRLFRPDAVPEEALRRVLQAGRMAGSAKAAQPVRAIVVRDQQQRAALAKCGEYTPHLLTAPVVVALVLVPEAGQPQGEFALFRGPFDAGRAAQNMMLAAWDEGLASCPASMHHADCAREVLGLPAGYYVVNTIAFGYAAGKDPVVGQRPRMALEDFVRWERWE